MSTATTKVAPPPAPVFTDQNPEYPTLVYNHKTRQTKGATDPQNKEALAKEGYVEEPFGPVDPDVLTATEVADLQALLAKAAKALAKLGKLSETDAEPKASK